MANYPQNTHYMQQQQQQQQQHQQQMNHQRQQQAQALYMHQQHAMHHQMSSDGSIRQNVQHMMMTPPGQRPQGRMMYMTAAPTSQAQQQHMQMQQQQQQQTQRAMAMNQQRQQQQQMMPNSQQQPQQHYYNIQPPPQRGMAPSPMKMPPQQQIKSEGMRNPIHMAPQQMILRGPAPSGYESIQSQVIIQQQQPQQQQQQQQQQIATSSSSQSFISRVPNSQPQQIRQPQSHSQLIRTSTGSIVQRIIKPGDVEMPQYVIRGSAPQGFTYVPSSSGEQQYHIVQQSPNFVQAQGPVQTTIRAIRHIQVSQPQTPLRMALTQPQSGNMVIQPGVVVIQSSSGGNESLTPVVLEQSTGGVIASSSNASQQVTIATTAPIQIKQTPQSIQRPSITTVVPPAATVAPKTTPSKTSSKNKSKKPASKPGPSTQTPTPTPVAAVKPAESSATVLTPQSKLVQNGHLDSLIGTTRTNDSYETSVKNAVNEFAETYAEFLLDELVDAARLRKVTKIENRDAKFVILRESNKEKDIDGKKK
jgi:hypothetical protein